MVRRIEVWGDPDLISERTRLAVVKPPGQHNQARNRSAVAGNDYFRPGFRLVNQPR